MKTIPLILALPFFLFLFSTSAFCQQDTTRYRFETKDGNEFIGIILSQDANSIVVKTENLGEITIPKSELLKMTEIRDARIVNGKFWFQNPQSTRYFWQPNAYGLRKGEGYYQNVWVLFNQVAVGVTDNISIGLGTVPLFLFAGTSTPIWITPKFSIPIVKDKVNIGGGALMGTVIGEENTNFGIAYGITTFGSRDRNLSLGIGYGYADGDWANRPTLTLSAMIRTGDRGYLMTENYYIGTGGDDDVYLFFIGGRYLFKKVGLDYGGLIPGNTGGEVFIVPWLGLTIPFGGGN